jgi:holo-[acyl-carrier-protein] synthase
MNNERSNEVKAVLISVGTDLTEVDRIRRAMTRHTRFLERIFTVSEIEFFESRGMDPASVAANFAGKEAVLKVLGTGIRGLEWRDIEILREPSGKPYVRLNGNALALARSLNIDEILISLSHTRTLATAYAVGQRR